MLHILLSAVILGGAADMTSTNLALNRCAGHCQEGVLARQPWALNAEMVVGSASGVVTVNYLWHTRRKKTAVALTILTVAVHGWAFQHNMRIARRW
jgi:hypothetical protein